MRYRNVREGVFLARPNRFIARVELAGTELEVHVKNTGRCRELLPPGARVWLERAENGARKTQYDLVAVQKGERIINMDAAAPNRVFYEWLRAGNLFPPGTLIRPEAAMEESRFDFRAETPEGRTTFLEVKGVTLEEDGAVFFPDAPTERGLKHVRELTRLAQQGYGAFVVFVIQMEGVRYFAPNDRTQPAFGEALRRAREAGVRILAMDCVVNPDELTLREEVLVRLERWGMG